MKEQAGKIIDFVREKCQGVPSLSKSIMRMAQGYQFFAWRKYSNTYSTVGWS